MAREALILIPGLRRLHFGAQRTRLLEALKHAESFQCTVKDDVRPAGTTCARLEWRRRGESEVQKLDVFEAYYGDLVPRLQDSGPARRLWHGTQIIVFWLFSGVWRALRRNTYMSLWLLLGAVLLALWYVGLLVVGLSAVDQITFDPGNRIMGDLANMLGKWGAWLAEWPVWVTITFGLNLLRVDSLANLSYFARLYLARQDTRNVVRQRAAEILDLVEDGGYERITVVAHSFGTAIGVDLLAEETRPNTRLVTLGGQLGFLQTLRTWVAKEIDVLSRNTNLVAWHDFHAKTDYLGAEMTIPSTSFLFKQKDVSDDAGLTARLTGETHIRYFDHPEVIERLLVWPAESAQKTR